MPEMPEKQMRYGCLFCRVGSEQKIAEELSEQNPHIEAIAPVKLRYHRGKQKDEQDILFPGYVFIRADAGCSLFQDIRHRYVYRILCDAERNWYLHGDDAEMVRRLFLTQGKIGYSTAYYDHGRIRIADGFLKEYEGNILRVNRRMRTAQISVRLLEEEVKVWLGFELLKEPPADGLILDSMPYDSEENLKG